MAVTKPKLPDSISLEMEALDCLRVLIGKGRENPELYGRIAVDACKVVLARAGEGKLPVRSMEDAVRDMEHEK
jgi:hypothetical protein